MFHVVGEQVDTTHIVEVSRDCCRLSSRLLWCKSEAVVVLWSIDGLPSCADKEEGISLNYPNQNVKLFICSNLAHYLFLCVSMAWSKLGGTS